MTNDDIKLTKLDSYTFNNLGEIKNYTYAWGDFLKFIAYLLMSFNIMTFFIGNDFPIEHVSKYSTLFLSIIFLFIGTYLKNQIIRISVIDFIWILFFVFAISRIRSLDRGNLVFIYFAFFSLSMQIIYKEKTSSYILPIKIIKYFGIIYAVSVFIQLLVPDMFFTFFDFSSLKGDLEYKDFLSNIENTIYIAGIPGSVAYTAGYISFSIGSIVCFNLSQNKLNIPYKILMYSLLIFALFLTTKRAHILFTFLSIIMIYYFLNKNLGYLHLLKKFIILFLIMSLLIYIFFTLFPESGIFQRFSSTLESLKYRDDISSGRTSLYETAWNLFLSSPIIGIGWGLYSTAGNENLSAHSNYLQILSETGAVGLTLFIIAITATWLITKRKLNKALASAENSDYISLLAYSLYIQTFFILYGFTGSIFYYHGFILIYFFATSMIYSLPDKAPFHTL